jgi:hypothetical protein
MDIFEFEYFLIYNNTVVETLFLEHHCTFFVLQTKQLSSSVSPQHITVLFCITPKMMRKESITAMAHLNLNLVFYLLDMIQEIMLADATMCASLGFD